ncbi:MAG: outer membrane protein [Saprospiraceae bacterium]|jgi:outer membrane protein
MNIRILTYLILLFSCSCIYGQSREPLHITLLNDDSLNFSKGFEELFKQEIMSLQSTRRQVVFESHYLDNNPIAERTKVQSVLSNPETDIVIGIGLKASTFLSQIKSFDKPTIASVIIDRNLLGLPITEAGTSGIKNFTYVESPFDVKRDLEVFRSIVPYENLAILLEIDFEGLNGFMNEYFDKRIPPGAKYTVLGMKDDIASTLEQVSDDYDGVYILSTARFSEEDSREFYHELSRRGLPSFALIGREQVEVGAMAGIASSSFIPNLARRIALDVLRISEGERSENLPVKLDIAEDDFVINMHTLSHLEVYPDFDILNQAILLNIDEIEGEIDWSIESMIYEALKSNLQLAIARKDLQLADEDINIAISNLKPNLKVNTSATWIDQKRVDASNGQAASVSWLANATLNQVIYSEPAMANVAIQKILKESTNEVIRQAELDIILESAQAFLGYLQTKSNVRIQNKNVDVTKKNLDISKSKERLGYSGITDVYRLETQLSQNIINLNIAVSNLAQARININRILNRDQRETFGVVDITQNEMISIGSNDVLQGLINNQRDLNKLTDFFVERAIEYLPEIQQLGYSIQAQERSLLSNRRSMYLPQISVQATIDQPIHYFGLNEPPQGFAGLTRRTQYAAGAQVSLPIFEGGLRKANIQKDIIAIDQLGDQRQDVQNSLEANLRSNMQVLSASYQQLALTQEAAIYSVKNFDIVQDLYRQGQADIITLVDAQNARLAAELNANNALYQLIGDFLSVERGTGDYFFLMTDEEKETFIKDLTNAVLK